MNPYTKAALSAVRLIAFALILLGAGLYASDALLYVRHRPMSPRWELGLKGLPILAGVILFVKARALAEHWTNDLD